MQIWRTFRYFLAMLILILLIVLPSGSVLSSPSMSPTAAVIEVTTFDDEYDTDPAECSLREAIWATIHNVDFGGCTHTGTWSYDTINLPYGTYDLTFNRD